MGKFFRTNDELKKLVAENRATREQNGQRPREGRKASDSRPRKKG